MQGSTETTFYVLTVYFGSVDVVKARHSLAVGLSGILRVCRFGGRGSSPLGLIEASGAAATNWRGASAGSPF